MNRILRSSLDDREKKKLIKKQKIDKKLKERREGK
jgi:hypothetical protein